MLMNTQEYLSIIGKIKQEIKDAQYRAAVHVNADMLILYYDIGCVINEHKSWGNKFIDNLATDIKIAFPESKGYSVRNLKYMAKFAETYYNKFGAFVKNNTHINKKIGCNSDCVTACAVYASGRCAHNTVFSRTENKVVALFGNLFAEMLGRFEIDFVNLLT